MLCAFFKQGQCKKGDKCKFSHDLNIERKGAKRNFMEEKKGILIVEFVSKMLCQF